jgi:hypothetical protein
MTMSESKTCPSAVVLGDERAEFERHVVEDVGYEERDTARDGDAYQLLAIDNMWQGWLARAAPRNPQPQAQNIDQLLIEAKAAPRFRNDTYDAVDRLDATLFSGDEFMATREIRQHFRYYLARWEKRLREYDEFDSAMDGGENG